LSRYTAVTPQDLEEMLATIGVGSIDELFAALVPEGVRLDRALDLPEGLPEQDVYDHLRELAARNVSAEDEVTFLGAGMYDTYVPAIVDMLTSRSEFLTPYTPYQPEVSQGNLQVMFEYQTAISELTGLPVSNASVYEGPSALGAAGYLAKLANGKGRFVISRAVHPHSRETLVTLARGYGVEVVEVGLKDGVTDLDAWSAAIDDDTSAVFFQQPNFLGAVEDAEALAGAAKNSPAVVVGQYDALTLGVLAPPGETGVDVAVDVGRLAGVVYLVWLGRQGIVEMGDLLLQRTAYARDTLTALDGVEALHDQPVVREFAVRLDAPVDRVIERCAAEGINPGYALGRDYEEFGDGLLIALTEQRTRAQIDRFAEVLGAAVKAERGAVEVTA
jgi:glycine cleavage system pyridoxal-binding protein P